MTAPSTDLAIACSVIVITLAVLGIVVSVAVCVEIVVVQGVRYSQVRRLLLGLMLTNMLFAVGEIVKAVMYIPGVDPSLGERVAEKAYFFGVAWLSALFEVLLLVVCLYTLFDRAPAMPQLWEKAGYAACSIITLAFMLSFWLVLSRECRNTADFSSKDTDCDKLLGLGDEIITFSATILVVGLWVIIRIKVHQMRAFWRAQEHDPANGDKTKIERVNGARLMQLERDAFAQTYVPLSSFQMLFVLYIIAGIMSVIARKSLSGRTQSNVLVLDSVASALRILLQALVYFQVAEHRANLSPSVLGKAWTRMKRKYYLRNRNKRGFAGAGASAGAGDQSHDGVLGSSSSSAAAAAAAAAVPMTNVNMSGGKKGLLFSPASANADFSSVGFSDTLTEALIIHDYDGSDDDDVDYSKM